MPSGPTYIGGVTGNIEAEEIPASPDLDDVVQALVNLGLVTQAS